eukprot:GILI01006798.1.p1 GENE.GILI01006798.1~~GILI01006798.1.p1  ORF type:complete len:375 (+),score=84.12 GILI01006798.1:69-1193(+)
MIRTRAILLLFVIALSAAVDARSPRHRPNIRPFRSTLHSSLKTSVVLDAQECLMNNVPQVSGEVRLFTYNVQWGEPGIFGPPSVEVVRKKIAANNPNLILLQDVKDCQQLKALVAALGDTPLKSAWLSTSSDHRNVGIISTFRISSAKQYSETENMSAHTADSDATLHSVVFRHMKGDDGDLHWEVDEFDKVDQNAGLRRFLHLQLPLEGATPVHVFNVFFPPSFERTALKKRLSDALLIRNMVRKIVADDSKARVVVAGSMLDSEGTFVVTPEGQIDAKLSYGRGVAFSNALMVLSDNGLLRNPFEKLTPDQKAELVTFKDDQVKEGLGDVYDHVYLTSTLFESVNPVSGIVVSPRSSADTSVFSPVCITFKL